MANTAAYTADRHQSKQYLVDDAGNHLAAPNRAHLLARATYQLTLTIESDGVAEGDYTGRTYAISAKLPNALTGSSFIFSDETGAGGATGTIVWSALDLNTAELIAALEGALSVLPSGHRGLLVMIEVNDITAGAEDFLFQDELEIWADVRTGSEGTPVYCTALIHNPEAVTDPTVNDDSDDNYSLGSIWINTLLKILWVCFDATVGAAVWLVLCLLSLLELNADTVLTYTGPIMVRLVDTSGADVTVTLFDPTSYAACIVVLIKIDAANNLHLATAGGTVNGLSGTQTTGNLGAGFILFNRPGTANWANFNPIKTVEP